MPGISTPFNFDLAFVPPWGGQQIGISIVLTLIIYGPLLMYVFGRRAWCRNLCPIGALLRIFSKFKPVKFRLVNDDCIGCGRCNNVCDMEIDVQGELKAHGKVRSTNCIVCFACRDVCPRDAIGYTLHRSDCSISSDASTRIEQQTSKRRKLSAFDMLIAMLWVGVVLTFSFAGLRQDAPQAIKVIMTPVLLLVCYGLALLAKRVFPNLSS